jgi:Transposase DDE domain
VGAVPICARKKKGSAKLDLANKLGCMTESPATSPLPSLLNLLSLELPELERIARETKAYRFTRGFRDFSAYMQFTMLWAIEGLSLRDASTWLQCTGLGSISPPSLQERIANLGPFLKNLVQREFSLRNIAPPSTNSRLLIVDATTVSCPKAKSTSFYLHTLFDPVSASLQHIHLSSVEEGESLRHQTFHPGDVVLADRVYANPTSIKLVKAAQADLVVRIRYQERGMFYASSPGKELSEFEPLSYFKACNLAEGECCEVPVHWKSGDTLYEGRVIGYRVSSLQAQKAQKRLRKKYQKRCKKPKENQIKSTDYVFIYTTLPEKYTQKEILEMYRYRWQIELLFKRMKSLLHIDEVRTHTTKSTEAFLWGKILVALLLERMEQTMEIPSFFFQTTPERRCAVSLWRLCKILLWRLKMQCWQSLLSEQVTKKLSCCRRGLAEAPRRRQPAMSKLFPIEWGS